ncbi:DNA primase large subunit Spp2 [Elasticomyces elasticus]|uniref:Pre-mRNA-splicing factor n=1 Tax=Elasticomyces elasticus TaxID=574655 RepID=A0AAN7VMQ1_9PEZI|nr:DNA primase large subunit Spp2 [Elasticomyces elasticus]
MSAKISLSLGTKKPPKVTPTNGVKRSHAALRDDDDDEHHDSGHAESISQVDIVIEGADTAKKQDRGPLIIAPQANRDWKEAGRRKRQKHTLPGNGGQSSAQDVIAQQAAREAELEALKPGFGLNVTKKTGEEDETTNAYAEDQSMPDVAAEVIVKPQTDDERALDALLGKTNKSSDLVLPAVAVTEEQAFDRDINSAPEMSTLDDYARVPVEQFGAALLRGMGWKEGQGIGSQKGVKIVKQKVAERRPALLGIGAKEEAAVAQEMGVWGKAAKRGAEIKVYNPVLLRDKRTGETYTEEELARKKEQDEKKQYEEEFDRKEKEREREKKERRRDGSRERDRDGEKSKRRRREEDDRRHDKDSRHSSRKDRDESDDEYRRRKEKERRRRDRDREDEEYERERSKRREGGTEKHGDRERDRRR